MSGKMARAVSLYVGNLPWTICNKELSTHFRQFGYATRAKVVFDKKTGLSKGYGFVQFAGNEGVERSLQQSLHKLEGNVLQLNTYNRKSY